MIIRFIEFIKEKKKIFLLPMLFALIIFGLIAILSQGEVIPFFYKIF